LLHEVLVVLIQLGTVHVNPSVKFLASVEAFLADKPGFYVRPDLSVEPLVAQAANVLSGVGPRQKPTFRQRDALSSHQYAPAA
jgi:hypothetical protein